MAEGGPRGLLTASESETLEEALETIYRQTPIPQFEEAVGADLVSAQEGRVSDRGGDYLTAMLNLLKRQGGVLFPGGKKIELGSLRLLNVGQASTSGLRSR